MGEFKQISEGLFKKKKWSYQSERQSDTGNALLSMVTTFPEKPEREVEDLYRTVEFYVNAYLVNIVEKSDEKSQEIAMRTHIKDTIDVATFTYKESLIFTMTYYATCEMRKFEKLTQAQLQDLDRVMCLFLAVVFPTTAMAGHWNKMRESMVEYEKKYVDVLKSDFTQISIILGKLMHEYQKGLICNAFSKYLSAYRGNLSMGSEFHCVEQMKKMNDDLSMEECFLLWISCLSAEEYVRLASAGFVAAGGNSKHGNDKEGPYYKELTVVANSLKIYFVQYMAAIAGYTDNDNILIISDPSNISQMYRLIDLYDRKKTIMDAVKDQISDSEIEEDKKLLNILTEKLCAEKGAIDIPKEQWASNDIFNWFDSPS